MDAPWKRWAACVCLVLGCDVEDEPMGLDSTGVASDEGTSGDESGTGGPSVTTASPSPSTTTTTTGDATTSPMTSMSTTAPPPDADTGDDTPPPPDGPLGAGCSVEDVTQGAMYDVLPKGETEGVFPTEVGNVLEDYCGCHTLQSSNQNIGWASLKPPGGSLFQEYADILKPYGDSTLGGAMQTEVVGYGMPPGSCPYPGDPASVLSKWFEQGMPDGANYVP